MLRHRRFLWRHRDIAFPLALFLVRRRAHVRTPRLLPLLLAVPLLGAVAAWWWLHRRHGGGGGDPGHDPGPAPAPPPPKREPAQPVGV